MTNIGSLNGAPLIRNSRFAIPSSFAADAIGILDAPPLRRSIIEDMTESVSRVWIIDDQEYMRTKVVPCAVRDRWPDADITAFDSLAAAIYYTGSVDLVIIDITAVCPIQRATRLWSDLPVARPASGRNAGD